MEVKTRKHFTAFLCCTGFLLALSSGAQEKGPAVDVRRDVVEIGDFFVLNCTTNSSIGSNSSCDIQERSSHRPVYEDVGPTWKAFTFNVDYWSLNASCVVTCNNESRIWETIVTAYQPPKRVFLYAKPKMEVGKSYYLVCLIDDVAPLQHLTVTLLKGEEQLLVKTYEDHIDPGTGSVTVSHRIVAQEDDHGKTVTCQTSLDLRPMGPLLKNTSRNISLWTFGALEKGPAVDVRRDVVEIGHFFVLNCTTNSSIGSNSSCDIQERSSHRSDYEDVGPTWKAFTFIVDYWSLNASCVVTCNNESRIWETIVTVYQPPEEIWLLAAPKMEVGKSYYLMCLVRSVAPLQHLTVTLLKGEEQLRVETYEDHIGPGLHTVTVRHRIVAQEADHGKTVTCQTSLDLRPMGPLLKNTSSNISLWTFAATAVGAVEQMTLELQKPSPGQSWAYNLICHITGVPPCLSLAVTFFKGSKRLGAPDLTNCSWDEIENYTVTLPVTLHPEDHGQEAYCHAAVDLSLLEPVYQTKSSGVSLKTPESSLAIVVAVTAVAVLLACVLIVSLIFIVKRWIN